MTNMIHYNHRLRNFPKKLIKQLIKMTTMITLKKNNKMISIKTMKS